MRARTSVHDVPLTDPLRPAAGSPLLRPLVRFSIEAADGVVGHGEAAPLEEYDGISVDRVLEALAAVDLALWDLAGRRAGRSVSELLGVVDPPPVAVNATIGAVEPRAAALEARRAQEDGFSCIKVKVGTPDDRQRLQAVRDAVGPHMLIRADANGAWTKMAAPERIRALSRFDIELFEEPVHGQREIEAVAHLVPKFALALDESASANLGTYAQRFCTAVCLKISSSGGITGLLSDAEAARAAGYEVYIASTLDGPLGIAAALHAAAVVRPDRHCGLATLGRFGRRVPETLVPAGGRMRMPAGPGLGDGLIGWYGQ
jgi:L-alanine-DL-glutamate epimerase-like enolase superfamily enzyme